MKLSAGHRIALGIIAAAVLLGGAGGYTYAVTQRLAVAHRAVVQERDAAGVPGNAGAQRQAELARLLQAEDEAVHDAGHLRLVILAGFGAAFLLVAGALFVIARQIRKLENAEKASKSANEQLERWLQQIGDHSQALQYLSEMGQFLQSCTMGAEAYQVVTASLQKLFPDCSGALRMIVPPRNAIETVSAWGRIQGNKEPVDMSACWALRRGTMHAVDGVPGDVRCENVSCHQESCICLPLTAHGEMLGVLTLASEADKRLSIEKRELAVMASEQIATTLASLRLREQLREQATRDPLTGLFNRRYMEETLERELSRVARRGLKLAVVMLDLDHFKSFNDTFGHAAGDLLLQAAGRTIQACIRAEDVACRYGGEEFIVIMPDAPAGTALARINQLRERIQGLALQHENRPLGRIMISAGVAAYPDHGSTPEVLLREADQALYLAKEGGRNRVVLAAPKTEPA